MMKFMLLSLLPIIIILILILINYLLSSKTTMDREKPSPFECGFEPITSARLPFSIHFFSVSIIFLIFDIEIIVLIPTIPMLNNIVDMKIWFKSLTLILMILFLGMYYEWNKNSIKWFI